MRYSVKKFALQIHHWILFIFSILSIGVVIIIESHLFKFEEETMLELTLALLSLLSLFTVLDVFIDRNKIEITLESISKSFNTASGYITNKSNLPALNERLKNCKELWVSGATLHGLFADEQRREVFRNFILKGKKLKILLYKKDHELESHILKLWPPDKPFADSQAVYKGEQALTFHYIKNILEEAFKKNSALLANVSIHELNTFLPHSLVIFDPADSDTCVVQVQIDLMGCINSNYFPVFQLNTIEDEKHKQLFINEFNFLCSFEQSSKVEYNFT